MADIVINHFELATEDYKLDQKLSKTYLTIDFKVTHEMYHDVTTLLYKNDFDVKVPNEDLEFRAEIYTFWTSFTNLYEKGAVGDFHLELIEK